VAIDEESGGALSSGASLGVAGYALGGPLGGLAGAAVGGLLGGFSGRSAKRARKKQERLQREMGAIQAAERKRQLAKEIDVFKRKSEMAYGDTVSSFAKAGVSLSDSPLLVLNDQRNEFNKTMSDIKETGAQEIRLMQMGQNAIAAQSRASDAMSGSQLLGSLLSTAGTLASRAKTGSVT
jgi:hypothetical protein